MKSYLFLFLLIIFSFPCFSQYVEENPTKISKPKTERKKLDFFKKPYYGGNFGLQFGNVTLIDISPAVTFRPAEKTYFGVGGSYIYYSVKNPPFSYSTNIYGGRIFARQIVYNGVFGHAEYEVMNFESFNRTRINVPAFLVGIGYQQGEDNFFTSITLLFNVIENENSFYQNPIFRIGFGIRP